MLPKLSGPIHEPESGGKPRQLVILLHGLGADGNDLIGLAHGIDEAGLRAAARFLKEVFAA